MGETASKIRGHRRVSSFEHLPAPPAEPIDDGVLMALGLRMRRMPRPLRDRITQKYTLESSEAWHRYPEGAAKRAGKNYAKLTGVSSAEKQERLERAGEHALEKAQLVVWLHASIAAHRAQLMGRSLRSFQAGVAPEAEDALYTADAIVDFAHCMRATPTSQLSVPITPYDLPLRIEQIGEHAIDFGESLAEHTGLIKVVGAEQVKRDLYWQRVLSVGQQAVGNLLTGAEQQVPPYASLTVMLNTLNSVE